MKNKYNKPQYIATYKNNIVGRFQYYLLKRLLNANRLTLIPRGRGSMVKRRYYGNLQNDISWNKGDWFAVYYKDKFRDKLLDQSNSYFLNKIHEQDRKIQALEKNIEQYKNLMVKG